MRVQRICKGWDERTASGRPVITMVHSAESVVRNDATQSYGANPAVRCFLPESEMRAVIVVITNILREQPLQMPFIHCHDVIQRSRRQLLTQRSATPFCQDPSVLADSATGQRFGQGQRTGWNRAGSYSRSLRKEAQFEVIRPQLGETVSQPFFVRL